MSEFYTVEQVAQKLQLEVKDVKNLIKQGRLETIELTPKNVRVADEALKNIKPAPKKAKTKRAVTPAQAAAREKFAEQARKRAAANRDKSKPLAPPPEATEKPKANGAAKVAAK